MGGGNESAVCVDRLAAQVRGFHDPVERLTNVRRDGVAIVQTLRCDDNLRFRIEDHKVRLAPGLEGSSTCAQASERGGRGGHPARDVVQRKSATQRIGPHYRQRYR